MPIFTFFHVARNGPDFEAVAKIAARLKPFGTVEMAVGHNVVKAFHDVPAGGSAWHEYTSIRSALERLAPHPKLAPFVNTEYAAKSFALLKTHAAINRKYGLGSALGIHAPWYWPEAFFEKYPQLRGPRIDHPRRGRREEFAPCVDLTEVQEMLTQMMASIDRETPELGTIRVWTNDAGGGLCWADWLYPGVNGPAHCQHRGAGERVRDLANALARGVTGRKADIHLFGNFSDAEAREITATADDNFFLTPRHIQDKRTVYLTGQLVRPIRGIFDPVELLKRLEKLSADTRTVFLDFHANSQRGSESPEAIEKVVDVVEAYLQKPARGMSARVNLLRELCTKWVGATQSESLLDTLFTMHETFAYRSATLPRYSANGPGVSMRHITRPLVAMPDKLTADEESWWLPHVFNIHDNEARMDYLDYHGSKLLIGQDPDEPDPRPAAATTAYNRLLGVASQLEKAAPAGDFFHRMATGIRIDASILRSINNFVGAQLVRDRNKDKFAAPPHIPPKLGDWIGDPDLQLLNEFMRDELDNTNTLIGLLENGGLSQMLLAPDAQHEDTFLLGPDLVEQLRKKTRAMRRHWLDAQGHLNTPHK